jgi:hypothetical protein
MSLTAFDVIIILFFYFVFIWIFRILALVFITKIIKTAVNSIKQSIGGQKDGA